MLDEQAKTIARCMEGFGLCPANMLCSSTGNHWYPKDTFIPPLRDVVTFSEKSRKLYIFCHDVITVFQSGLPYVWRKTPEQPRWHGFRPTSFRVKPRVPKSTLHRYLCMPVNRLRRLPAWKRDDLARYRYFRCFPPHIIELVERVHREMSWGVLQCLCRIPCADEWFAANPAVCALAYYHYIFNPDRRTTSPFRVTRSLFEGKQKTVLERTGFHPSDRKLMAKIPPEDLSLVHLFTLRKALREQPELRKFLRHLDGPINKNVFSLLGAPVRRYVSAPLLQEVSARKRTVYAAMTLRELEQFQPLVGRRFSRGPFKSLAAIQRVHNRLVGRVNAMKLEDYSRRLVFPAPPIPGAELPAKQGAIRITPIETARELVDHGRVQQNCVASYGARVANGRCFIYRAEGPRAEMHTLCIVSDGAHWDVSQIAGPSNTHTDPEVRRCVTQWLTLFQPPAPAATADKPQTVEPVQPWELYQLEEDDLLPF